MVDPLLAVAAEVADLQESTRGRLTRGGARLLG
jgi:hypothetical protein